MDLWVLTYGPSLLKFRYSEKATKFWKNLPIYLTLPSNVKCNGRFFFKCCDLLRISELYQCQWYLSNPSTITIISQLQARRKVIQFRAKVDVIDGHKGCMIPDQMLRFEIERKDQSRKLLFTWSRRRGEKDQRKWHTQIHTMVVLENFCP